MPVATAQLLVDLDDTLGYSTDITDYWLRDGGFDFPAQGRNEDLGLAEMGRATFVLDNKDGRFSPANVVSPYNAVSFAHGTYPGDGTANQAVNVGFRPKVVIVKGSAASEGFSAIRSDTMTDTRSVTTGDASTSGSGITSLTATGFTVGYAAGDAWNTNENTTVYYWEAFGGPNVVTGTYTGTTVSNPISGVGFQPKMVWILPQTTNDYVTFRTESFTGTNSLSFGAHDMFTDHITAIGVDGFTVGTNVRVNRAGTWHFVAFNQVSNLLYGSYVGNNTINTLRPASAHGITIEFVHIKGSGQAGLNGVHRSASLAGTNTLSYGTGVAFANAVTAFAGGQFQLGTGSSVNTNPNPPTHTYYYFVVASAVGGGRFEPYHRIKATVTWNAVDYVVFEGIITMVRPDPRPSSQQCVVQATDLMYVLSRTDIRCPLMTGYTGPMIHRLIDYAEDGEIILNPRFDELQLLGDYSIIPATTTTLTRMTTGAILEGNASLKVTVPAAEQSGVRHTSSGYNGVNVRGVAYVMAEDSASEGLVFIQLSSNLGTLTTSADVAITSDRWTRLEIDGAFPSASTTQFLNVRKQNPGGATAFRVGAFHMTPYISAIDRNVDEGQTILDNFARPRGKALTWIQQVTENELGALFYMDGGTAVYEDKHHRWVDSTVSQATFDEVGIPVYEEMAEDRIKTVVLDFPRWVYGDPETQLWELDRVPLEIPASGSVSFEVDFGGSAAQVVMPTVDYWSANSDADGGGTVEDANLLVTTWNDWGAGFELTLENQQTYPVYLRTLVVYGMPIRVAADRTPARASGDGPPIAAVLSHNFSLNGREPSVQSWAQYLANRYGSQRARLGLSLSAPWNNASLTSQMEQILERRISDRITFTNNNLSFSLGVNSDFYIDRITRRVNGNSIECDWNLTQVDPITGSWFIIGTSTINGAHLIAP